MQEKGRPWTNLPPHRGGSGYRCTMQWKRHCLYSSFETHPSLFLDSDLVHYPKSMGLCAQLVSCGPLPTWAKTRFQARPLGSIHWHQWGLAKPKRKMWCLSRSLWWAKPPYKSVFSNIQYPYIYKNSTFLDLILECSMFQASRVSYRIFQGKCKKNTPRFFEKGTKCAPSNLILLHAGFTAGLLLHVSTFLDRCITYMWDIICRLLWSLKHLNRLQRWFYSTIEQDNTFERNLIKQTEAIHIVLYCSVDTRVICRRGTCPLHPRTPSPWKFELPKLHETPVEFLGFATENYALFEQVCSSYPPSCFQVEPLRMSRLRESASAMCLGKNLPWCLWDVRKMCENWWHGMKPDVSNCNASWLSSFKLDQVTTRPSVSGWT